MESGPLDPAAIADLYARYAPELRAFLTGILRNKETAAEVLQSTFVKAAEAGHRARPETIKGWLFQVAYHQAMLLKRREGLGQRVTHEVAWQSPRDTDPVEAGLVRAETVARVRTGMQSLPVELQQIVRLRIYDEKTFAEIARELDLPLGTVVTRMKSALQKLNQLLRDGSES